MKCQSIGHVINRPIGIGLGCHVKADTDASYSAVCSTSACVHHTCLMLLMWPNSCCALSCVSSAFAVDQHASCCHIAAAETLGNPGKVSLLPDALQLFKADTQFVLCCTALHCSLLYCITRQCESSSLSAKCQRRLEKRSGGADSGSSRLCSSRSEPSLGCTAACHCSAVCRCGRRSPALPGHCDSRGSHHAQPLSPRAEHQCSACHALRRQEAVTV